MQPKNKTVSNRSSKWGYFFGNHRKMMTSTFGDCIFDRKKIKFNLLFPWSYGCVRSCEIYFTLRKKLPPFLVRVGKISEKIGSPPKGW